MGVPHHAANYTAPSTNHSDFEALASQILLDEGPDWDVESALEDYGVDFYNTIPLNNMGAFVHTIASTTKPLISVAFNPDNIGGQRFVIALLLPYSMINTSGVLDQFAKDVGII